MKEIDTEGNVVRLTNLECQEQVKSGEVTEWPGNISMDIRDKLHLLASGESEHPVMIECGVRFIFYFDYYFSR